LIEDAAKASGVLSQPWETKTANAVLNPFDQCLSGGGVTVVMSRFCQRDVVHRAPCRVA
jgi:hypothetical protein